MKYFNFIFGMLLLITLSSCANNVRFAVFADAHYADRDTVGAREYRDSLAKMQDFVENANAQKVDFIIELGDLKDMPADKDPAKTISYLQTAEKTLANFKGPRYHVLGNHDADCISKQQFNANISNTSIPSDKTYYSFNVKTTHFIVLDANYNSDHSDYDSGNFDWTDANIPPAQLAWLEKDLQATNSPTIIFIHQLLDGKGPVYVKNAPAVRKILEDSNKVIAVFQGHHHAGSFTEIKGIKYHTLKGMVESENNAYAIVEIKNRAASVSDRSH